VAGPSTSSASHGLPDESSSFQAELDTKRETAISGTLQGASLADTNYTIVVFAVEERFWIPGGRRNVAVAPDAAGRFSVRNLPAGAYRIAVIEDYDSAAGLYADLLRQLAGASPIVVTLTAGQRIVQDLQVK
jgi:hypothetical protein